MRVTQVNLAALPGTLSQVLAAYPLAPRLAQAQARQGHAVTLLWAAAEPDSLTLDGVRVQRFAARSRAQLLAGALTEVAASRPDAVHLHGITTNTLLLAALLRARCPGAVVVLQDQRTHRPPRLAGRLAMRLGLRAAHRTLFAAQGIAQPFVSQGLLRPWQVALAPGGSTDCAPVPQPEARARLGLGEGPLYLWPHRLAPDKAPLFAAEALLRVLRARPAARLLVASLASPLREDFDRALAPVAAQVRHFGRLPLREMALLYSAADLVLSTSPAESYGFALVEAMACGATPVVSAIPASLQLVGPLGRSFAVGDLEGLVAGLLAPPFARDAVRAHFEAHLTYDAMARATTAAYESALTSLATGRRAPRRSSAGR